MAQGRHMDCDGKLAGSVYICLLCVLAAMLATGLPLRQENSWGLLLHQHHASVVYLVQYVFSPTEKRFFSDKLNSPLRHCRLLLRHLPMGLPLEAPDEPAGEDYHCRKYESWVDRRCMRY